MEKDLKMLYEGKAKKVYEYDKDKVVIYYKDDATAFDGLKKAQIESKGILNNLISSALFEDLNKKNIPTHFIKRLDERSQLCYKTKIIPLEVIVRNVAAGSMAKRYGIEEGTALKEVVYELSYKNDELHDPLINDYHVLALGIATRDQLDIIYSIAKKVNEILLDNFKKVGIKIIDFKLEFGIYNEKILLSDEISPDTCRLWDAKTNEKLDKDRFRRDLGNVVEAYEEILKRLGINRE
ncbi:MAG: phosphoribosylaminoimidazolesuccinocarboxamide synthase [Spirochaetales bacterium]|nr:phosphoribosylaminoimidazolesuccinocarboxamide synthase [Spirochaetales bacterium]